MPRATSPALVAHDSSRNRAQTNLAELAIRQPCSIPGDLVANRQWALSISLLHTQQTVFIWTYRARIGPTMLNSASIFTEMSPALPEARKLFWQLSCQNPGPGPWFSIKMSSYQYRKSHCGGKTILRPSYLHNGISYTGKMTSLYWIGAQASWQQNDRSMRYCIICVPMVFFFKLQFWWQNYVTRTMPESGRCSQHKADSGPVLAHRGMYKLWTSLFGVNQQCACWWHITIINTRTCQGCPGDFLWPHWKANGTRGNI